MMQQFEAVLRQLCNEEFIDHQLGSLDLLCPQDREQLSAWNSVTPPSRENCLHDLVSKHSLDRPNAPAISSWDGDMTFNELEVASCSLAKQLKDFGIQRGSSIPLCFGRSRWVVVAMMAVLQIGATCVCLDPTHPKARIHEVLKRTDARFALTSPETEHIMADTNSTTIVVPIATSEEVDISNHVPSVEVNPHDTAFIVFTSGSTGIPKGVLLQHSNLATSILSYSSEMQINQDTRALHFASYSFDASMYEIFGTLINGGCLCIPSEYDKMNHIELFINEYEVNWAFLTPSFITLMRPESIPCVKTVVLGGEAVTQENVRVWGSKVTLVNGYGPAEATVCAVGKIPKEEWKQGTIGKISGALGWIAMPNDPSRLAPIGAIGELLIEGAVVSRGYLNDEQSTAASYVTNLPWRSSFQDGSSHNRFYRSGDLFQYDLEGNLCYVGRRDTQIKLRGQRIELSEIEENLKQLFPDALDVVAEVVVSRDNPPAIMAFIANALESDKTPDTLRQESLIGEMFIVPNEGFLAQVSTATTKLRQRVPDYMVPSVFLQLSYIPRTSSDKADRKKLRDHAAKLSRQDIQQTFSVVSNQREPFTPNERAIQSLWAEIFKVPLDQIGSEDDFFFLGGDSISAMKMVGLARQRGLRLLSAWIFAHPVLSDLAKSIEDLVMDEAVEYTRGSLLGITNLVSFASDKLAVSPELAKELNILDILPTTEFQRQLLRAGNVTYSCLHLHPGLTEESIKVACHVLVNKHSILRTVFASRENDILQVVLGKLDVRLTILPCDGNVTEFCTEICSRDSASFMTFGTPHFQPFLVTSRSKQVLVLRMTHAQYDGVSLPIIWQDLVSACNGHELQPHSLAFSRYLQFRTTQKSQETFNFWRDYLDGSQMTDSSSMDILPQTTPSQNIRVKLLKGMPIPSLPNGITLASLVRAAWSLVLAQRTKRRDVVFGNIINGRTDVPLRDIETLSGPTVIISPFRATLQKDWSIKEFLNHIQSQFSRAMPFANVDPGDIIQHSTSWSPATEFGSILTHQDVKEGVTFEVDGVKAEWELLDFGVPTDFHVVTWVKEGKFWVHMSGPSSKIRADAMEGMARQLCEVLSKLSDTPGLLIEEVLGFES